MKIIPLNPDVEQPGYLEVPDESQKTKTLLYVIVEYTKKYFIENPLSNHVIVRYGVFIRNISKYLAHSHNANLLITDVKLKHAEELKLWLHSNLKSCSASHSARHIEFLKRVMKYAVGMEYTSNNVIDSFIAKRSPIKRVINLEEEELNKLRYWQASNKFYDLIRDLFLFQCYTGLSYGDLSSYQILPKNDREWIFNQRKKTEVPYYVPVFPEAREIHEKYFGNIRVPTNQIYNRLLKEIAIVLGIQKHLTTHVARKTFATRMNDEGFSLKSIAQMLGNTQRVCEVHYINNTTSRIEKELEDLGYNKLLSSRTLYSDILSL